MTQKLLQDNFFLTQITQLIPWIMYSSELFFMLVFCQITGDALSVHIFSQLSLLISFHCHVTLIHCTNTIFLHKFPVIIQLLQHFLISYHD